MAKDLLSTGQTADEMMEIETKVPEPIKAKPTEYKRPELRRWGSLRELTAGGGGFRNEPVTKRTTRF
jgi:hypothetical protein